MLALLAPALALIAWLFHGLQPAVFLSSLYDSSLPFAFRLPVVALCLCALGAWALHRLRENISPAPTRCTRSPRRILFCALLALGAIMTAAFGLPALGAILSLLAGVLILKAALGLGLAILALPPLNLTAERFGARVAERTVLASTLGLGALALLMFLLGSLGVLNRFFWLMLLAAILFLTHRTRDRVGQRMENAWLDALRHASPSALAALFFLIAWFILQSPLVTAAPLDYDVLEYHLAAPAQYLRDGHISFLRENVYAAMPASAEMLFLLPMCLFADPYAALPGAHVLLWGSWALSALGVYALARRLLDDGREATSAELDSDALQTAPLLAAILFAIVPLGAHLAADFYVEHIQTLAHVAAVLAAVAFLHDRRAGVRERGAWLVVAGFLAGFCCTTKYSALLFTLGPLLVFVPLLCMRDGSIYESLRAAMALALPAGLVFAPWALRNALAGGDPLYPLGLVLQRRASPLAATPQRIDHLEVALRTGSRGLPAAAAALRELWPPFSATTDEGVTLASWTQQAECGPHLLGGLLLGLLNIARNDALLVALVFFADLFLWLFASHRVPRFFYTALPLLAALGAMGMARLWTIPPARKLVGGLCIASVLAIAPLAMLYAALLAQPAVLAGDIEARRDSAREWRERYAQAGNGAWAGAWGAIDALPSGSRTLFIGDAQTFYVRSAVEYNVVFNAPLLEDVLNHAQSADEALLLLRTHGITHLYFNYAEWLRLDTSYALRHQSTDGADGARGPWTYAQFSDNERDLLWRALTQRVYTLYERAWPRGVFPAYLKLNGRQYGVLQDLVRNHSVPLREFKGRSGAVVAEIRALN
jgi:hypothetical protein